MTKNAGNGSIMDHLAYYNEGCEPDTGGSVVMGWIRRQFRRILLPASNRLVQILGSLCERLDAAENQLGRFRSQLSAFRTQLGTIRTQLAATQIRLDDHQIRLDDHQNQLGQIPDRFDDHQARLDDHHDRLARIPGRLDVADAQLSAQRDLIAALTTQLDDLRSRQEEQAARFPATVAFGWDYVAMTRRLGVLEEHVDALLAPPDARLDAVMAGPAETAAGPTHPG